MRARYVFRLSAAIEVMAGIGLLLAPSLVIQLLLSNSLSQIGVVVARILGLGLLSLGISTWEPALPLVSPTTRIGLCTYNLGVAVLLSYCGSAGQMQGLLLWPGVALHGLIGAAMLLAMRHPNS